MGHWGGELITPRPIGYILLVLIVRSSTTTEDYSPIHMVEIHTACTHRGQSKKACSPMVSSLDNPEPSHGTAKLLRLTASCLQKYHILSTYSVLVSLLVS